MVRGYFSYFSSILLAHILALMVTIELSRPEMRERIAGLKINLSAVIEKKTLSRANTPSVVPRKMVKDSLKKSLVHETHSEKISQKSQDMLSTNSSNGTDNANALESYKAELRAMIDRNKYYPVISKRLGQTGTVVVAFTLLEDGNIIDVRIDRPSRFDRLNLSALDAVKKVERFKPIPKEFGGPKMDVKVPVTFVTI
jgi:protein TonB